MTEVVIEQENIDHLKSECFREGYLDGFVAGVHWFLRGVSNDIPPQSVHLALLNFASSGALAKWEQDSHREHSTMDDYPPSPRFSYMDQWD